MSIVQVRFAGSLALFIAVFGGFGFVRLINQVDMVRDLASITETDGSEQATVEFTLSDSNSVVYLLVLFVFIGGFGIVQTAVKTQIVIDWNPGPVRGSEHRYAAIAYRVQRRVLMLW